MDQALRSEQHRSVEKVKKAERNQAGSQCEHTFLIFCQDLFFYLIHVHLKDTILEGGGVINKKSEKKTSEFDINAHKRNWKAWLVVFVIIHYCSDASADLTHHLVLFPFILEETSNIRFNELRTKKYIKK